MCHCLYFSSPVMDAAMAVAISACAIKLTNSKG